MLHSDISAVVMLAADIVRRDRSEGLADSNDQSVVLGPWPPPFCPFGGRPAGPGGRAVDASDVLGFV